MTIKTREDNIQRPTNIVSNNQYYWIQIWQKCAVAIEVFLGIG